MTTADQLLKKFNLTSFSDDAIQELDDDLAKDTFAKIMKWTPGRNVIRITPQLDGRKLFERTKVHFVPRPDGKTIAFACAAEHHGQICVGCTMRSRAQQAGNDELAKSLSARSMYYFSCLRRGEEKLGLQLASFSRTQMTSLGKQVKTRREELGESGEVGVDLFHLMTGYDVTVEREGTTRDDTEYTISIGVRPKPITTDMAELEALIESMPDNVKPRELKTEAEVKVMMGAVQATGGGAPQLPRGKQTIEGDATGGYGGGDEYEGEYEGGDDDNIPY